MAEQLNVRGVLVSSPGKVILHGEHAVVYGKTAIATSVDLRCYALILPTTTGNVKLELPDMELTQSWSLKSITELLGATEDEHMQMLRTFCNITDTPPSMKNLACLILVFLLTHVARDKLDFITGIDIFISSELPFGAGLGSSAAYSVCLATGLLTYCNSVCKDVSDHTVQSPVVIPDSLKDHLANRGIAYDDICTHQRCCLTQNELKLINKWSFEAEKLVHGTPSGIDNTISVFGGAIKFRSGLFDQMQKMPSLSVMLVYTKVSRSTKKMVSGVKQRYNTYPQVIGPLFDSIEEIVTKSESLLEELHSIDNSVTIQQIYTSLQELFCINHYLLNAIGVGHESLDRVQHIALKFGLGAKLTGAGGGGCAIVLIPQNITDESIDDVRRLLSNEDFDCWLTSIGGTGVTVHCVFN